jgi:hypothetical protein
VTGPQAAYCPCRAGAPRDRRWLARPPAPAERSLGSTKSTSSWWALNSSRIESSTSGSPRRCAPGCRRR